MTFDHVVFWLFLPVVWLLWRFAPLRHGRVVLLLSSLVFYGWWDWRFIGLLLLSSFIDYQIGNRLVLESSVGRRRGLVGLSVALNLSLLGFFKYVPFVLRNAHQAFGTGYDEAFFALWIVPVGLSFFTFQTMSYTIDLYRREVEPAKSYVDFLAYVSFFPQLVAGPIVRARLFLPQLARRPRVSAMRFRYGVYRCIQGLFLKVCVADGVAHVVGRFMDSSSVDPSPLGAWMVMHLFSCQVFADFAGYTWIAVGVASFFGFRFPPNFRAPYLAKSNSELWSRWHISLSTWFRDYLFVPLGGGGGGPWRTTRNIMIVMVLSGIWHGAGWGFAVWGALHGVALVFERLWIQFRGGPKARRRTGVISGVFSWMGASAASTT